MDAQSGSPGGGAGGRERSRAARRQAILRAAEAVFAERGFASATMAEIARRAGYTAGNLYNVFENKERLLAEVILTRMGEFVDLLEERLARAASIAEVAFGYVDVLFEFVAASPAVCAVLMHAHYDFDWHATYAPDAPLRDRLDGALEVRFARAIERGEIPPAPPGSYVALLQGMTNTHLAQWVRSGGDTAALFAPRGDFRAILRRALGLGV